MKSTVITTSLILSALTSFAQFSIKGKIIDQNNHPVVSATVYLRKKSDGSIQQTNISDSSGFFLFSPRPAHPYQIRVTSTGFEPATVELADVIHRDTTVLIRLVEQGKQLNQVSIYAKGPIIERKTDRVVFNVENSLSANGGDGVDALSKAPGVRINDNGISIAGKNTVKIMVNERLIQLSGIDLINYLKSIPSDNIKRIEIITNPSARYEADGNSGLINIVLKKNLSPGFNGMINTGVILASRYTTGLTAILNYNLKKLHVSSNITSFYSKIGSFSLNDLSDEARLWTQQSESLTKGKGLRGDVRVDYDISSNTVAGLKFAESSSDYTISSNTRGLFYSINELDSGLRSKGKEKLAYMVRNIEFYIEHKLDTSGKKIEFASNYFNYGTADDNLFQSTSYTTRNELLNNYLPVNSNENENIDIFASKIDLILPYKFASLEFGGKISTVKNKNNLNYNTSPAIVDFNNNAFNYTENTQSLYTSAAKDLGKWSIRIGLRIENTQTTGVSTAQVQTQKNSYLQLFPTLYLKHTLNKANTFTFSYGKRINRPDYSLLNPARIYSAINSYEEGNPLLQPSFSHNFELNYNYKDWLSTTVYSNFVTNGFSKLNLWDSERNIQSYVPKNYADSYTVGLSETVTFNKISCWESNNQFNGYFSRAKSNGFITEIPLNQLSGYVSTDNTFILNRKKTLMANATFWYQFPEESNRLITQAYYAADFSLRAMFMERKLTLAVNVSDIFKTSQRSATGVVNGITQFNTQYRDNRRSRFTILYRFGNSKANKAVRETDDTETGRIKQVN